MTHSEFESFTIGLMTWWQENQRTLPWKDTKDPYKIWLSEIILQQTTVKQGLPYYLKFVEKYPDINQLALADSEEIFKMWEGLGYYNRAKNMINTAQYISSELQGIFPNKHDEILKLKGIGPYTSAAIVSFAFEQPYPVVDGNVLRVVSRYQSMMTPIDTPKTVQDIRAFLNLSIQYAKPSEFNQSIMDFGSLKCTPRNPECDTCIMASHCKAFKNNLTHLIPIKSKKVIKKNIFLHFLHIHVNDSQTIVQQRETDDIWPNLFQFPNIESKDISDEIIGQIISDIFDSSTSYHFNIEEVCTKRQVLTHKIVTGLFSKVNLKIDNPKIKNDFYLVDYSKVKKFAFPKIMLEYLNKDLDIS